MKMYFSHGGEIPLALVEEGRGKVCAELSYLSSSRRPVLKYWSLLYSLDFFEC